MNKTVLDNHKLMVINALEVYACTLADMNEMDTAWFFRGFVDALEDAPRTDGDASLYSGDYNAGYDAFYKYIQGE